MVRPASSLPRSGKRRTARFTFGRRPIVRNRALRLEILENRSLLAVSATITDGTLVEPDFGSTNMEFTVRLSAPSEGVKILNYFTTGDTATPGVDYDLNGGNIVIQPGETEQTISIPIFGDPWDEPDEQFLVELFNPGAGTLTPIADINEGSGGSGPNEFIEYNGAIYFSADDGVHGRELWKYDGQHVSLVADIYLGLGSSNPGYLTVWNGGLYFGAFTPETSGEIWRFDGTTVVPVTDFIKPQFIESLATELTVFKNELYFSIDYNFNGHTDLWKLRADHSAVQVANLYPQGGDNPGWLTVYKDLLVFTATDGHGYEMWTYDGVSSPRMHLPAPPQIRGSNAALYTEVNGILYLNATGFDTSGNYIGRELFQFDGTQLSVAADLRAGFDSSSPERLVAYNGAVYFAARGRTDAQDNPLNEFWKFDGQTASVVMSEPPTMSGRGAYAVFNNELYFGTHDPDGGQSIWRFDGAHKIPVVDFDTGNPLQNFSFRTIGERLYFRATDGFNGGEMWMLVPDVFMADGRAIGTIIDDDPLVNFAPETQNSAEFTDEDTPLAAELLASDANGDALTYVIVTGPEHGTLEVAADGSYTFAPDENFFGDDSFVFYAHDGMLSSNVSTVSIDILPVNDPPIARNDNYVLSEDTLVNGDPPGVLLNDSDAEEDPLSLILETDPLHGSLEIAVDGSFEYTPHANYHGGDQFSYRVFDGRGGEASATVLLTIAPINDPPVAALWQFGTPEDTPLAERARASDVDGDALTFAVVTPPQYGSLDFNSDGNFVYTPSANFHGTVSFRFTVSDGQVTSSPAPIFITVVLVNDAPTAADDSYSLAEDSTLSVAAPGILGNDADVDGDSISAAVVSDPAHGMLVVEANGSFEYSPATNYFGSDQFTYRTSDGKGGTTTATVRLTISAVNDAPLAVGQAVTTAEDQALSGVVRGSDDDGEALSIALATGPAHGALTLETNGSFNYTPHANYHGNDSFTFTASDGMATSALATVSITVSPVNDLPVAADDAVSGNEDVNLVIAVLANDEDADADALTPQIVSGPASGGVTVNANGTITYDPPTDFHGSVSFTYRISDGTGLSNVATVAITVNAQPESPVISVTPDDGAANTINLSATEVAVAILSSDAFNAPAQVVVSSLTFGKTGSEMSLIVHKKNGPKFEIRDVNGDGRLDVVAYFKPSSTGLTINDTQATLRGRLADGSTFADSDAVTVTKPKGGGSQAKGGGGSHSSAELRAREEYFASLANDEED